MWQVQWQQVPGFLTQINWPNWLAIVGTSSATSSIVVLSMQGLKNRVVHRWERRDAALDVAVSLEGYARVCRAMMHRADWARDEFSRTQHRDAAKSAMLPAFVFPENIQWRRLSHRVVSDLRDFPARIHAGCEDLASFAEYGDLVALCEDVSLESAKAARDALALARETRRKHSCVPWRPGAKDADLNRDLLAFISAAEKKRDAYRGRQTSSFSAGRAAISGSAADDTRMALE
ncbi:hypothetical protein [Caballeronia sp. S22]|uniref:hypothetical protein n=1 Tax=Caballeronia sp. S22 TaxID=3137182 RepID=UPI0035307F9F